MSKKKTEVINLVEDKQARDKLITRVEVLDKIKVIPYLTDDLLVTSEQAANFYGVELETIKKLVTRNKEELELNGLKAIKGSELKDFKAVIGNGQDVPSLKFVSKLTLVSKRALLNIGMLLTESEVATKVRDYLLNVEENSTPEQKVEAAKETLDKADMTEEELKSFNTKKLLNKQLREESKLVKIQASINKLTLYGLTVTEASYVIQKAIVDKVNIEKATLDKVKELNDLEVNINRGIIREKIAYVAKNYYDDDYETVYHIMSDKMRYHIGFNMRAERDRLKAKNKKAERGCKVDVPSYLDIIVQYNAYASADKAIKDIMDEKEIFKALAQETRVETLKENNKVKKEESITPKEVKTDNYTF